MTDVDFLLPGAASWTRDEIEVRQSVIEELARLITHIRQSVRACLAGRVAQRCTAR